MTSVKITPDMVKELRERTGVGMGKCKEALDQAQGDMEKAIDLLRKAGMASAVKKEGRETKEGMVVTAENKGNIALVEINAETDFVVQNDRFKQFAQDIAKEAADTKPASLEAFVQQKFSKDPALTIDEYRAVVMQSLGENIRIRRLQLFPKSSSDSIAIYSHMGGKIVTLVEVEGAAGQETLARDIAMHIAAEAPDYLNPEEVPADIKAREEEIARGQVAGKPAAIMDKIVEGKLKAFYDQVCLLRQKYVKDNAITVENLVANEGKRLGMPLKIRRFVRWQIGA
ncbi:MAG TPA: translation elongation factor Ts [Rhabdochlamydiaceae bacterium]|jgi:elongation factor Ts|nr:translation elongation factor Ts [Rhabdochlamydiaceae bacterium]